MFVVVDTNVLISHLALLERTFDGFAGAAVEARWGGGVRRLALVERQQCTGECKGRGRGRQAGTSRVGWWALHSSSCHALLFHPPCLPALQQDGQAGGGSADGGALGGAVVSGWAGGWVGLGMAVKAARAGALESAPTRARWSHCFSKLLVHPPTHPLACSKLNKLKLRDGGSFCSLSHHLSKLSHHPPTLRPHIHTWL